MMFFFNPPFTAYLAASWYLIQLNTDCYKIVNTALLYSVCICCCFCFVILLTFILWRQRTFLVDVERSIVQLIADFTFSRVHLAIRFISWINGYNQFSEEQCQKDIVIVSICTNGLGHLHQAMRVLSVLKKRRDFTATVAVVAKRSKLPSYANVFLEEYGFKEIIDLDFELDYEGGNNGTDTKINNLKLMFLFCYSFIFYGVSLFGTIGHVLEKYRPRVLLSFFEPTIATFVNAHNAPTNIISAASQGSLNIGQDDLQKVLFFKLLWHANVGKKGKMIPFCQYPLENAIPQIVNLPSPKAQCSRSKTFTPGSTQIPDDPTSTTPFFVAYSCMPMVLLPGIIKLKKHRVILFAKHHTYWAKTCEKYTHILVLPRSPDFIHVLASSAGLIAQPSRGVVTQAIALGKPVYLFCPKGHVEQELNYKLYLSQYEGIASPATLSIEEWEKKTYNLESQAQRMRSWLCQTDERILMKIGPLLPLHVYK